MFKKGQNLGNQSAKGYKHTEEAKNKIALASKGNQYRLGQKVSEETRKKLSEVGKGRKVSQETKKKLSKALKGRKMPWMEKENNWRWKGGAKKCIDCGVKIASRSFKVKRCLKCAAKLRTKENNCNWKGGITKLVEQIRKCFKYRQWRSDIWTRDDFTCQKCEKRGGKIHAHHIKSFSEILWENKIKTLEEALECEELWNINNGRTLCYECHKKTDNYLKNICKF